MKSIIKPTVLMSTLVSALFLVSTAGAQEVAMIYATNASTANVLSQIDATLTPDVLAREFSKELQFDLASRLPKEQAKLGVVLQLRADFARSIHEELAVRLRQELNAGLSLEQEKSFRLAATPADLEISAQVLD